MVDTHAHPSNSNLTVSLAEQQAPESTVRLCKHTEPQHRPALQHVASTKL